MDSDFLRLTDSRTGKEKPIDQRERTGLPVLFRRLFMIPLRRSDRMKRVLALMLTLASLTLALSGCVRVIDNKDQKVIAVVAKGQDTPFWNAVLAGAEDAATANGYAITFRGPDKTGKEGVQQQMDMVQLALDNGVLGLAMDTVGAGFDDMLMEIDERGLPVVQFESGIAKEDVHWAKVQKKNPVVASVNTENVQAAQVSAQHLYEAVRTEIEASQISYKIGIIQHDFSDAGEDRAHGFQDEFTRLAEANPQTAGKYEFLLIGCVGPFGRRYANALDQVWGQGARAVFMTSEEVGRRVYERIQEKPHRYEHIIFTGFDGGKEQVQWMRSSSGPRLLGNVTQDAYNIGYNSIIQCINALEARGVTAFVTIPGAWYDAENLESMLARNMVDGG